MRDVVIIMGHNSRWLVREAVDHAAAMQAIHRCMAANVPGARYVFCPSNGAPVVLADVIRITEDDAYAKERGLSSP